MVVPYLSCQDERIGDLLRRKLFADNGKLANELCDTLIMRARNGSHKAVALIFDRVDGRFDLRSQGNGSITLMFVSAPTSPLTRACSSGVVDTGYEVRVLPPQSQAQSQAPAEGSEPAPPLDADDRTPTQ